MPTRPAPSLAALAVVAVLLGSCADGARSADTAAPSASATAAPTADAVVHRTEVPSLHPSVDGYDETELRISTLDGTEHILVVKVARTVEEKRHGLMEVEDLPAGTGMWFPYEEDRTGGFWMKDTLVPLSIAYVDGDGRIVGIVQMQPCTFGDACPSYPPPGPYRAALEVPQGWFADHGIGIGDVVREIGD